MEQHRLRLGDTLDDYCPRERRVTNHVIVAMIEDDIKQTRCTTCDAEHAYKGARVPKGRKKETPAALYKDVLAGMPDQDSTPILTSPAPNGYRGAPPTVEDDSHTEAIDEPMESAAASKSEDSVQQHEAETAATETVPEPQESPSPVEDGPVHRPLIRATLPRPEGQKDVRPVPDFTIRQPGNGRGNGNYRGGDPRMKSRQGHGNRPHGGGTRFGGHRPSGQGRGGGRGNASAGFRGQGQPRQGGGRKRSR